VNNPYSKGNDDLHETQNTLLFNLWARLCRKLM
jgi:hypothetical protein